MRDYPFVKLSFFQKYNGIPIFMREFVLWLSVISNNGEIYITKHTSTRHNSLGHDACLSRIVLFKKFFVANSYGSKLVDRKRTIEKIDLCFQMICKSRIFNYYLRANL